MMITLVIEFGRQRRKFDLKDPIDIDFLENEIKSNFGIDHRNRNDYFIQIFDEFINDYLDLTSNSFQSTAKNFFKGQILSRQFDQPVIQTKVSKQQVVGLITLESAENSLQKWSQLLQRIFFILFPFIRSSSSLFRYSIGNKQRTSNNQRNNCRCQSSCKSFFLCLWGIFVFSIN